MKIQQRSSKDLLLIGVLRECAVLLNSAYAQLHDPQFQELAQFADSAHSLLLKEVVEEEGTQS